MLAAAPLRPSMAIRHRKPNPQWSTVIVTRHVHVASHGHIDEIRRDVIAVRTSLAKGSDGGQDDAWVDFAQFVIPESEAA